MSEETSSGVELGYVVESPSWCLESKYFPSKVGGKPAWLELSSVPENVKCKKCSAFCVFLCQVYAPLYEKNDTFHRTIFIFVCLKPECNVDNCHDNFVALRSQLMRKNTYYSPDPPIRNKSLHLKDSHKDTSGLSGNDGDVEKCQNFLLPEFEIIWEPEKGIKKSKENVKKEMEYLQSLVKSGQAGSLQEDASVDALEECGPITFKKDKVFQAFRKRVECNPEQVLRYCVGEIHSGYQVTIYLLLKIYRIVRTVGQSARFELQVLPQLLCYLSLDNEARSVDWGTLVVYTCTQSCNGNPAYKEEFIYKQDH